MTHYTALQMFVDSEDAARIAEVAKEMSGVACHMEDQVPAAPWAPFHPQRCTGNAAFRADTACEERR